MGQLLKTCGRCDETKPLDQFDRNGSQGYRPECKACRRARRARQSNETILTRAAVSA
jgi:hypothetical protein